MKTIFHNQVPEPASRTILQRRVRRGRATPRRAFTLVEILVALAIMMVLLVIVLVPMNLGLEITQVGRARAQVQVAAQSTLSQMERELRRAVYVFPNSQMPGITERAPYNTPNFNNKPYVQIEGAVDLSSVYSTQGICGVHDSDPAYLPVNNTSRLDFLLPKTDASGIVSTPVENAGYLVSYYARRLYVNMSDPKYYDEVENPIVLFRAQIPYRYDNGDDFESEAGAPSLNANLSGSRYPDSAACSADTARWNRGSLWLTQNTYGEPDLERLLTVRDAGSVVSSHTLLTPRGMALVAPFADATLESERNFQPTTTFTPDDTNGDGKIDRVTIYLELSQFAAGGSSARAQRVRVPLTVDLPNIR